MKHEKKTCQDYKNNKLSNIFLIHSYFYSHDFLMVLNLYVLFIYYISFQILNLLYSLFKVSPRIIVYLIKI